MYSSKSNSKISFTLSLKFVMNFFSNSLYKNNYFINLEVASLGADKIYPVQTHVNAYQNGMENHNKIFQPLKVSNKGFLKMYLYIPREHILFTLKLQAIYRRNEHQTPPLMHQNIPNKKNWANKTFWTE